jgi:mono/diheme cytochrome c family protein
MARRVRPIFPVLALAAAVVGPLGFSRNTIHAAQQRGATIWDGAYTTAQAERGKSAFAMNCARCHKADLEGDRGPALKGDAFMMNWEGESLNRLFVKVRDTMPPNFGAVLEPQTKIDLVAYLLQENGYPDGLTELGQDSDELDALKMVKKGANTGAPNFSLVRIVGCLTEGSNRAWLLTHTSEPVVVKDDGPTATVADVEKMPLGADTFLLVNVARFRPESHNGQKLEAKGLLYRSPGDNRINLTSLQMVSPACGT